MTSGEMTFGRLDRYRLHTLIKKLAHENLDEQAFL